MARPTIKEVKIDSQRLTALAPNENKMSRREREHALPNASDGLNSWKAGYTAARSQLHRMVRLNAACVHARSRRRRAPRAHSQEDEGMPIGGCLTDRRSMLDLNAVRFAEPLHLAADSAFARGAME